MDGDWEFGVHKFSTSKPPRCENYEEGEDYDYSDDDDDNDGDYDEEDVYDEKSGLACPFCSEDFDVLGLFCHIDVEHLKEAKASICPVCVTKVETSMAVHLITQHKTVLKLERNLAVIISECLVLLLTLTWSYILCKKKFRNGGTRPALSFLKKELQDEYSSTSSEGSPPVNSSAAVETDSFLLPFFYNPRMSVKPQVAKPSSEASEISNSSQDTDSKSDNVDIEMPTFSDTVEEKNFSDKFEEKNQRCEFIQGLLLSMILDNDF